MIKLFFLVFNIVLATSAIAESHCFIAKENNQLIKQEGDCSIRHSPCSTFKIAISLMGYNEGILEDETHPEISFKEGDLDHYGPFQIDAWKESQNPTAWIKNSCIWYSRFITQKLGSEKFQHYVNEFQYGNKNVDGDPGLENGLTDAWLSSSLQISPEEQIDFLEKLLKATLPANPKAISMTQQLLFIETLPNDWKLYGKTGTCFQRKKDGTLNFDHQMGWFVGWAQKKNRTIVFAQYAEDEQKIDTLAGSRNREIVKNRLIQEILRDKQ